MNKACLEKIGMMERVERLPLVSLNDNEYKDVEIWVEKTLKELNKWRL